jgi:hypothetical protein
LHILLVCQSQFPWWLASCLFKSFVDLIYLVCPTYGVCAVNRRVHQHKVGKFRDTNILGVYMSSNVVVYGVTGSSRFFRLV